ncbi:hypothetical protein [Candidatus Neptunochlamydia vexilliferae]|uniref:Uncharacterized protein n=1 Tax=Candidatus Neptunichlamydia vexilliferae TaxID=1651774 RepID=A0ABS0AXU2_9BACT|nr:hypothetical protein [Candidatus Neptunochlamydia vexilliferae]MBF5058947.1 hypothetical protein [Candidatus Neptunochlamydia vexilliferae]
MRFGLTKEHHDFFHRHHHIEFEGLLSEEDVKRLYSDTEKRDRWRTNPEIKKIVLRSTLAEVASNLCKVSPLRIGFDQTILNSGEEERFLPLNEKSSIQKVACGLILDQNGSGTFFSPEFSFPLTHPALLIVYVEEKAQYIHEEKDPYNHALKKLGYGFGDRIRSDTHPIVFRG